MWFLRGNMEYWTCKEGISANVFFELVEVEYQLWYPSVLNSMCSQMICTFSTSVTKEAVAQ